MGVKAKSEATEQDDPGKGATESESSEEETEEEGSEGEESEEKGEGSSEEKEGKTPTRNFFDPKDVPKELKPVWNRMQASFTRAMTKSGLVIKKAAAFDELVQLPWVREGLERSDGRVGKKTKEDDDEGVPDDSKDSIREMVREELKAALKPFHEERRTARVKSIQGELKEFKKEHPDWQLYADKMEELMEENPNLSYRRAYVLAKDEVEEEEDGEEQVLGRKKRASGVSKKTSAIGDKAPKGLPKNIREAWNLSKQQLGM